MNSLLRSFQPGLNISRKNCKHIPHAAEHIFLSFPRIPWSSVITGTHISQDVFATNMLTALKPSLKHDRKHVLRLLQPYGDKTLSCSYRLVGNMRTRPQLQMALPSILVPIQALIAKLSMFFITEHAKHHGKNYIKVRPLLILHFWHNCLLYLCNYLWSLK